VTVHMADEFSDIAGKADQRTPDSYANGLFGVITVGPWRAAIQVAQAGESLGEAVVGGTKLPATRRL
jgi:hypothetical protein